MDAIDAAIKKEYHLSNIKKLSRQTWREFETICVNKKVVLFGAGIGADFYLYKYGRNANIDAVIDNNPDIQGLCLQDVLWETFDFSRKDIKVNNADFLNEFNPQNTVILITGLRSYESVVEELEKKDFHMYFSLICMEAKYRMHSLYKGGDGFRDKKRIYDILRNSPVIENKIFLYTECSGTGHGKVIVENLLLLYKDVDIVWVVKSSRNHVPEGVRKVLKSNYRAFVYEFFSSKIILADTLIYDDIEKKNEQCYIQVKHWGSVTLKTFGYEYARYRNDIERLKICDRNKRMMNFVMVGSKFDEETCRRGLGVEEGIVYVGSPRSDVLFKKVNFQVKEEFGIPPKTKLLLYAPTFRLYSASWENIEAYIDLDFIATKKTLENMFGGEWMILLRLHPVLADKKKDFILPSFVVDVSDYYDSEELVAISDVMITDYSSIMFEPAFVKKPVFLLAIDKERYLQEEREFLIDYNSLPFSIAENNEELQSNIKKFNKEDYEKKLDDFMRKYGVHEDGHAGERAAKFILNLMRKR